MVEINDKYKLIDKTTVKIDLVDMGSLEKISICTKGDLYGHQYMTEKQPYELNLVQLSLILYL